MNQEEVVGGTAAELRSMFGPGQLAQLDIVRQALLSDPKALDNRGDSASS